MQYDINIIDMSTGSIDGSLELDVQDLDELDLIEIIIDALGAQGLVQCEKCDVVTDTFNERGSNFYCPFCVEHKND